MFDHRQEECINWRTTMFSLLEIATKLKASYVGPDSLMIHGVCSLDEPKEGHICFVEDKQLPQLANTHVSAVIVSKEGKPPSIPYIQVDNPKLSFVKVMNMYHSTSTKQQVNIHRLASIDESVEIGNGTSIGPFVSIAENVTIGDNCTIHPNVTIYRNTQIGSNVIIHSGCVIGSDGYGYVKSESNHVKIPHIGHVVIEDDVEIGANTTIDRGTLDATTIRKGTKIDNLVQIGHNVTIGKRCLIAAMTGIAGSTAIEDHVTIAGQCGVAGHLTIGTHSVILGKTSVTSSLPPHSKVYGSPALPVIERHRIDAATKKLPALLKQMKKKI